MQQLPSFRFRVAGYGFQVAYLGFGDAGFGLRVASGFELAEEESGFRDSNVGLQGYLTVRKRPNPQNPPRTLGIGLG